MSSCRGSRRRACSSFAVADPVRYRDLIVDPTPKMKPPAPPRTRQPGTPAGEPTMASCQPGSASPVKWIPQTPFMGRARPPPPDLDRILT